MTYPFISCKCITYARTSLLEEAIESFLRQDYPGKKELIIVNDYPLQKLIYDHPEIKIYNLDETFSTIGEKENYAIERCSGDLIAVWDDDDIALSNHLRNIATWWRPDANLLHWQNGVFYNEPNITKLMALGNSGIVYSKRAWEEIGKSPIENAGGDMTLVVAIHNLGRDKVVLADPPNEECSWFYRWGSVHAPENGQVGIYHQSGAGTDVAGRPNIIQRHSQYIESMRVQGFIPTGDIQLNPHFKKDYTQMLKDYCNANK
jgi:hypothetical protein